MMSCPTYAYLRLLPILALAMALVTAAAQEAAPAAGQVEPRPYWSDRWRGWT